MFYHVVNKGMDNKLVFRDKKDLERFIKLLDYYRFKNPPSRFSFRKRSSVVSTASPSPLVHILCYSMMPDHFHLVLQELEEGSVSKFLSLVSNSYTRYFNARQKRLGPLFKGSFSRQVVSPSALLELSLFIHTEPVRKGIVSHIKRFPFSSFSEYHEGKQGLCLKEPILQLLTPQISYQEATAKSFTDSFSTDFFD